jgi:hypothetical protein
MLSKIMLVVALLAVLAPQTSSFKNCLPSAVSPLHSTISASSIPQQPRIIISGSRLHTVPPPASADESKENKSYDYFIPDDNSDPYADLMNFAKPIEDSTILSMSTISSEPPVADKTDVFSLEEIKDTRSNKNKRRNPILKPLAGEEGRVGKLKRGGVKWDDFMEEQFADMDDELGDEDQWIQVCDINSCC